MNKITKVMVVSFTTNAILATLKILAGYIGKSSALIADGIHSFSDLSTDVIAIFGNKIALTPADHKHPYGHGKVEYLTSLVIGGVILFLGLGLIYEVIEREIYTPSLIVVVISIFTIIAKLYLSNYIIKKGNQYKNNILIASGKESSTDVVTSIVVLVSIILMQFSEYSKMFMYTDKIASIIVGLFIVRIGFNIMKENISTILGEQVTDIEYIQKIKDIIFMEENIKQIENLTILKYGPHYKLISEVTLNKNLSLVEAHNKIDKIEKLIKKSYPRIDYINFHMSPEKEENENK